MMFQFRKGSYLGRGYDAVGGQPFGWAFHRERDEIREHLSRRLGFVQHGSWDWFHREQLVSRIQERIHKNRPSYAEHHAAWRARQPQAEARPEFTREELARLVELFAGANDPLTASIAAKAERMLS